MANIPVFSAEQAWQIQKDKKQNYWSTYLAMYSSWLGGITKDPHQMSVPIDDHMVHRGDGVFEAIKTVQGKIFLLDEHLARLKKSADALSLALPFSLDEIREIILQTLRAAQEPNTLIRLYVSRGPGGFTTNPYESIGSQLYIVITKFNPVAAEKYQTGVKVALSKIPIKEPSFAQVKSCNYLPNVLMKKESVDRKLDFTLSVTSCGHVGEGSTENVALISKDGYFCYPVLHHILRGTTMMRVAELSELLIQEGALKGVREGYLKPEDFLQAKEAFMIGTTLDVLPISEFEGKKISADRSFSRRFNQLLQLEFVKGLAF